MDSTAQLRLEPTPEFSLYSYEAVPANCLLTLKAAAVEEADRAPVSCTFVLDTSGSMAGNKLDLMRKASRFSLRHLAEKDRLGIIAFATEVRSRLSVAPVESEHRESATKMLQNMGAGGATGLAEALFEGVSQQLSCARASSDQPPVSLESPEAIERPQLATTDTSSPSDLVRAVFLFTDGQANRGLTRQADIVQALKNILAATAEGAEDSTLAEQQGGHTHTSPQITVHTFGFGHNANPDMLAAIADTGSGTYYYIDTADAIPAAFADALGGMLSVAAQNIVLRISPVNGARIRRVRCGFDTHAEGADYIVRVPDVYAEEARDLVVALELPAQHSAEPGGVEFVAAEVRVEFIDIVRAMPAVVVGEVRVKRSAETPVEQSSADADARVRSQITRLDATEAMQRAMLLADGGDFESARGVLRGVEEDLESLALVEASDDGSERMVEASAMVAQLQGDVRNMVRGYTNTNSYTMGGNAFAQTATRAHHRQRSTLRVQPLPGSGGATRPQGGPSLPTLRETAPQQRQQQQQSGAQHALVVPGQPAPAAQPARRPSRLRTLVQTLLGSFSRDAAARAATGPRSGAASTQAQVNGGATMPSLHDPLSLPGTGEGNPASTSTERDISVYSNAMQTRMVKKARSGIE